LTGVNGEKGRKKGTDKRMDEEGESVFLSFVSEEKVERRGEETLVYSL